jgi:hypothetical protein
MSFSKSPISYEDVRDAMDKALASPRGILIKKYRGDPKRASLFRQRAYYYRRQSRADNIKIYPVGHTLHPSEDIGWSIYDPLEFDVLKDGTIVVTPRNGNDLLIEEIQEIEE